MIVNFGQRHHYVLGVELDTGNSWNNFAPFLKMPGPYYNIHSFALVICLSYNWYQNGVMDKLPDEILLRIFSFIHFAERIILCTVCWRWSSLLYNHSLLENISITKSYCADRQLTSLFTASKRLITVDFFNSRSLNGSCILLAGLSRLRHLTLTGTSITDKFYQASYKLAASY